MADEIQEETLELTERELAIVGGQDPDSDVAEVDAGGSEVTEPVPDPVDGTEAPEGGTDAAATGGDTGTWVTDDVKALAGTYGMSDAELGELDNEVEFLKLARLLEKRATAAKPEGKPAETQAKEGESGKEATPPADALPTIDPQKYIDAGYDDDTVALARVAAAMQKQLAAIAPTIERQRRDAEEAETRRVRDEFHRIADEMGRYGKSDKLDKDADGKRVKLWDAARDVAGTILSGGQQLPPLKTLLQRAELAAFGDEIMAERREALVKSVKAQSGKRRSVGRTTVPTGRRPANMETDPAKALANNPAIAKFWDENAS